MKTLGANSIRVYHVDPTADHSGCMKEFDNAGIYALIDLDTFTSYILPVGPLPFLLSLHHPAAPRRDENILATVIAIIVF